MKLLSVENLFVKVENFTLRNLSFYVKEGESVGLVGESGSGKTLLSHLILQLVQDYKITSGSITFLGENLLKMCRNDLQKMRGSKIGYIFQEPLSALNPLQKIHKQLSEAILIHNPCNKEFLEQRIAKLLNDVQLDKKILNAYPYELSGGQRQRVCIAIALANHPKLIIADEPTTALDSTTQKQIIALLEQLKEKLKISILLISHNLAVVSKICQRVIVLQNGEIVESGLTQEVFKTPKHIYTKTLLEALQFHYNNSHYEEEVLLRVNHLSVVYPIKKGFFGKTLKSFVALEPLCFALHSKENLGIIGESGSGKSSLANAICRSLDVDMIKGEMNFLGENFFALKGQKLQTFRGLLQIVFQDPFGALNPKMNILQIIQEGLRVHHKHLSKKQIEQKVIAVLYDVGLDASFLERYPNELSGGQRQRVNIARSLILRPKVLILDEPTSALDCATQRQILNLFLKLAMEYQLSYICISHDLSVIATLCQNVLVLKEGKLLESGATKDIFNAPKHPYVKELLQASIVEKEGSVASF